jgi:peptide/nickel transport system ATP-binding protein
MMPGLHAPSQYALATDKVFEMSEQLISAVKTAASIPLNRVHSHPTEPAGPAPPLQIYPQNIQMIVIGISTLLNPKVVVADEPTSALDVSVQAAILNLLVELQAQRRVAYLFISHDLGVVRYLSDRIAVLYLGRLMEVGPAETVFSGPHHPYTEALLSAVPSLDGQRKERIRLEGEIPSAASPPSGCVFHTRCPRRLSTGICESTEPPLAEVEPGHLMSCHIPVTELRLLQDTPHGKLKKIAGS